MNELEYLKRAWSSFCASPEIALNNNPVHTKRALRFVKLVNGPWTKTLLGLLDMRVIDDFAVAEIDTATGITHNQRIVCSRNDCHTSILID